MLQYLREDIVTVIFVNSKFELRCVHGQMSRSLRTREAQFVSPDPAVADRMYLCKPNNVGFGRGDMQIATSNGYRQWPLISGL